MAPLESGPEDDGPTDEQKAKMAEMLAFIESLPKPRQPFRLKFDEDGHAIPPTPEERAALNEAFFKGMAEMRAIPDDPSEPDEVFWRAMDES